MNIQEYKTKYPIYKDIPDTELADLMHKKFYPQVDKAKFMQDVGVDPGAMEVAEGFAKNLIPNTEKMFGDVYEAFAHPVQTAKSIYEVASGAVQLLVPGEQANEGQARAVGKFFKDRYGTLPAIKRAIRDTPAEVVADLSTLLTGGGSLAATLPGKAGKIGGIVSKFGNTIDPVSATAKFGAKAARGAGKVASTGIGTLTGTGSLPLESAFKVNLEGGEKARQLNLHRTGTAKGGPHIREVVKEGKDRLTDIVQGKQKTYQDQMAAWQTSDQLLDITETQSLVARELQKMKRGDKWIVNPNTRAKAESIQNIVDEWAKDPTQQNAWGFDGLKQRLDDVSIDFDTEKRVGSFATKVKKQIKSKIENEVPEYAKAMQDYKWASDLEQEIKTVFSMKHKSSTDTIGRKLMSILRSNVNASFDERLALLRQLDESGMIEAKLAGQSLRQLAPQGIMRLGSPGAALGAGLVHPGLLPLGLLAQSPRAMGGVFSTAGKIGKPFVKAIKKSGLTEAISRNITRGAYQVERTKDSREKAKKKALHEANKQYLLEEQPDATMPLTK